MARPPHIVIDERLEYAMQLTLINHNRRFAVEQAVLNYFPRGSGGSAVVRLSPSGRYATAGIEYNGKKATGRAWVPANTTPDNTLRLAFYRAAKQLIPSPPWGALTGVRPVKKAIELLDAATSVGSKSPIVNCQLSIVHCYDVAPSRAEMAADCAAAAVSLRDRLQPQDIALYIGIPFCPTRCAYCSFVSTSTEREGKLIEPYIEALCEEIRVAGETVSRLGLRVRTVYWGGGTPAVLSVEQFSRVMRALKEYFVLDQLWEHTFEAGRPDVITADKLSALHAGGVTRIAVNPQSLQQSVLDAIGRRHTPEQFFAAYELSLAVGFTNINVDLIAGLPGDDTASFLDGLSRVIALSPANITVHTLARKRSARVTQENITGGSAETVGGMLNGAIPMLRERGYAPYYLYRQKFTEGGYENVGWTKPGFACLYNLCMMEELCTVLSLGAGGVTKYVAGNRIERIFHCKYPLEYMDRRGTIKDKLRRFEELYHIGS